MDYDPKGIQRSKYLTAKNRELHAITGLPYIPCHLGLKRLDPSGWQMIDPTATICLSNEKRQKKDNISTNAGRKQCKHQQQTGVKRINSSCTSTNAKPEI